jgi:hypothetical protein
MRIWRERVALLFLLGLVSASAQVIILNPVSGGGGDGIITDGLVGRWALDEGSGEVIGDTSGEANDGQRGSSGAGSDANDPTWAAHGLDFDGSNDYVLIPFIVNPNTSFTLVAAFEFTAGNDSGIVWAQQSHGGGVTFWMRESVNVTNKLGTQLVSDGGEIRHGTDMASGWNFAALRYSTTSGNQTIFLNQETPATNAVSPTSGTGQYTVGIYKDLSIRPWVDGIAYLLLYDRALTDQEVADTRTALAAILSGRSITLP